VPVSKVVANINVDGGNVLGRTNDLRVLGEDKSSLGGTLRRVISSDGMRITPDEHPERGYFYRSDHFSFAKAGVPSVSVGAGTDFIGHPKGWGSEQLQDYTDHRYHQPSDEYRPDWDLAGAVQLSNIVLRLGLTVANSKDVPTWSPNAEFKRTTAN
jgi:Zn-dependent M28 family amino/carboxypeptidase